MHRAKDVTVQRLRDAIRKLPSDRPVHKPGVWYLTQKQHWLGWLSEYHGPGAYGRKGSGYDARFAYNHVVNPRMLLWLVAAAGIPRSLLVRARRAQRAAAERPMAAQAGAIRRCVRWETIEAALWSR